MHLQAGAGDYSVELFFDLWYVNWHNLININQYILMLQYIVTLMRRDNSSSSILI